MRTISVVASFLALCSCKGTEAADTALLDVECDGKGDSLTLVTRKLTFGRVEDGISPGFDLDGRISDDNDAEGCNVEDFTSPDGVPGIDNSIAALLPVLEQTEAAVLEPLVQDSINGGALLLMMEMSDIDDPQNDACVDVSVFKGAGVPMIGNDGWMLPNQTLEIDTSSAVNAVSAQPIVDGRLEAGPIPEVSLVLQVLDLNTVLVLTDVRIQLERGEEEGVWTGMLGGGVLVQDLVDAATLANVDPAVYDLVGPVLNLLADLEPNEAGQCERVSVTMEVEAIPAFVYEDASSL